MFEWLFGKPVLRMNAEERQNLTTLSMLGGAVVMSGCVAALIWILRYSWPDGLLEELAPKILDHMAWIAFGCLGLVAVAVIAQATIAVGGRMKGKFGPAEFEAEANRNETRD